MIDFNNPIIYSVANSIAQAGGNIANKLPPSTTASELSLGGSALDLPPVNPDSKLSPGGSAAAVHVMADTAQADSFESKLRSAMTSNDDEKLKNACKQFEELMLGIMYKSMKATVQRSSISPADPGRETFEQWQDDALMKRISERGTFGLADMMYKQLSSRMKNAYELIDDNESYPI